MERVFHLRKSYRNRAIACLLGSLSLGLFCVFVSFLQSPEDRVFYAATFFPVFCGCWICAGAAAWNLLKYSRGSLNIKDGRVCQRRAVGATEVDLASVSDARWRSAKRAGITLRTPTTRLKIDFTNFAPADALELVRLFRDQLPESIQTDWLLFADRIALRARDGMSPVNFPLGPDEIFMTRRRWDKISLPVFLPVAAVSVVLGFIFNRPVAFVAPFALALSWLDVRLTIPRNGSRISRIRADGYRWYIWIAPGQLLVVVASLWALGDLRSIDLRSSWPTIAFMFVGFGSLLATAHWAHFRRHRRDLRENGKLILQRWEDGECC